MNIVIEGFDASGKSTLAQMLSRELGRYVMHSDGPPKSSEEINERARVFLSQIDVIFDRHPCVGEVIYSSVRGGTPLIDLELIRQFYESKPLILYCRGQPGPHIRKEDETDQHIQDVMIHARHLQSKYDAWALEWADVWVRPSTPRSRVIRCVKGILQ